MKINLLLMKANLLVELYSTAEPPLIEAETTVKVCALALCRVAAQSRFMADKRIIVDGAKKL